MKDFFILKRYVNEGDIFIDEYTDPSSYGKNFATGEHITDDSDDITQLYYKHKTHRKTDYVGGIFSFPVVSERFKKKLVQFDADNLEFHSVKLTCKKTNESDNSYSFTNILNHISCFDREKSEFTTSPLAPQVILKVQKLALKEENIQNRNIFRIKEIRSVILVSSKLKEEIEKQDFTGITFIDVESFSK